jgi:ribosomal protein L11 methyltransferase
MFKLNKSRRCSVSQKQIQDVKEKYDVVIANIIDGVLMELKRDLWRALDSKGHMILSGILTDGAKAFIKAFLKGQKVKVVAELHDSEWTAFLIQKA